MYENHCQNNKTACIVKAILFAILALILFSIGVMGFIDMGKSENMFSYEQKNVMSGLINTAAIVGGVLLAWMSVKKFMALGDKKKEPSLLTATETA